MTDHLRPLRGRVALVTGSGRNIGRAIAIALARAGARVVVNGHRDGAALDEVVGEIEAEGGSASACLADVTREPEVARLVAVAGEVFGPVDIAVSNVGSRPYAAFLDISPEDWDDIIRTNLTSAFYLARNVIPSMRDRRFGRIIHVSGLPSFAGTVSHRAHSMAAKAGLHGLTKAIAREFGGCGITANTIAPGAIDTVRDWSQYRHQDPETVTARIPAGRYGSTDEIAQACVYLAEGAFVSGQVLHVNGGEYMA